MKLRARLTLILLTLALLPLALVTLILVNDSSARLWEEARRIQQAVADIVVADVTRSLELTRSELETLAVLVSDPTLSTADRERIARAALLRAKRIDSLTVYRADGASVLNLLADTASGQRGPAQIGAAQRQEAQLRGYSVGRCKVAGAGAKRRVEMLMIVPIWRGRGAARRAFGYVAAAMELTHLSRFVATVSREQFDKRSDRVFIFDKWMTIIAAHDPRRLGKSARDDPAARDIKVGPSGSAKAGQRNYIIEYTRAGVPMFGALKSVGRLDWYVVVEQTRDEAYQALRATWKTGLLVGAGACLIAVVLGLLLAGGLARPINAVARAAKRVAGGDFEARVPGDGRGDEVGEMARAFNVMSDDLRGYRQQIVEETRIRADLSRYLSAELVESVVSRETELKLGGERRDVTVLFADVVAFTPLAEKHSPEEVVAILNELFTFLTEIVFKHGGVVDKFIGDCVMAVFGVPEGHDDDPERAVSAALEMMQWLEVGNAKWRRDLGTELSLGIGLNSGEVVAGNLGSEKRMEYTVIGDAVNVAARLETLAQAGQVLITADTAQRLDTDDFELEDLGEHPVAGRAKAVRVFEVKE